MARPEVALSSWIECLNPVGLLALEEVERVTTRDPWFEQYLQAVDTRSQAGELLTRTIHAIDVEVADLHTVEYSPPVTDVAAFFAFMLRRSQRTGSPALVDALDSIAAGTEEAGPIMWTVRRTVILHQSRKQRPNAGMAR